ncbi:MAG: ATP-binding protein [Candidatus Eisenbacteria bacterium]|uniref:ATP-binding protein n=1 Tax=Eiseniibacteriota bacterium TaxID=2212470 RepID=A0A933W358_UNCEI|nr:ATP-binding protein [Candidatus Eisenbacteria bacterium]
MSDHAILSVRGQQHRSLRLRVDELLAPSAPVSRRDLFAGRHKPIESFLLALEEPGTTLVVFGEPGTGKSSLVAMAPEFAATALTIVRVTAEGGDTFPMLWRKVADQVRTSVLRAERGLAGSPFQGRMLSDAGILTGGNMSVAQAVALVRSMSEAQPVLVAFDAFERTDVEARAWMAQVVTQIAAIGPRATLVIAGSANSAGELVPSMEGVMPLHLTRMSNEECLETVLRALRVTGLTADDSVVERIAMLSCGLPGAVQELTRHTAVAAITEGVTHLTSAHLTAGVRDALEAAGGEIVHAYEQSIIRARRGIYPEILLACALSPRDSQGTFAVADVNATLQRIVNREVRGLTNQIAALTEEGRGAVLAKEGAAKLARYHFVEPMLEPYILLRGLEPGWATSRSPVWLPASDVTETPKAA